MNSYKAAVVSGETDFIKSAIAALPCCMQKNSSQVPLSLSVAHSYVL